MLVMSTQVERSQLASVTALISADSSMCVSVCGTNLACVSGSDSSNTGSHL